MHIQNVSVMRSQNYLNINYKIFDYGQKSSEKIQWLSAIALNLFMTNLYLRIVLWMLSLDHGIKHRLSDKGSIRGQSVVARCMSPNLHNLCYASHHSTSPRQYVYVVITRQYKWHSFCTKLIKLRIEVIFNTHWGMTRSLSSTPAHKRHCGCVHVSLTFSNDALM